jgi:phosphatidylglycerophosphate synthase
VSDLTAWYFLFSVILMEVVTVLLAIRIGGRLRGLWVFCCIVRLGMFYVVWVALFINYTAAEFVLMGLMVLIYLVSAMMQIIICLAEADESWLLCRNASDPRKLIVCHAVLATTFKVGAANWISIVRFAMAFLVPAVYLERPFGEVSYRVGFFMVFLILATDFLDGRVARKFGLATDFGMIFDPISDKVSHYLALGGLFFGVGMLPGLDGVPFAWVVVLMVVILAYDVGVAVWWCRGRERIGSVFGNKVRGALFSTYIVCAAMTACFDWEILLFLSRALFFMVAAGSLLVVIFSVDRVARLRGE